MSMPLHMWAVCIVGHIDRALKLCLLLVRVVLKSLFDVEDRELYNALKSIAPLFSDLSNKFFVFA